MKEDYIYYRLYLGVRAVCWRRRGIVRDKLQEWFTESEKWSDKHKVTVYDSYTIIPAHAVPEKLKF